MRLVLFLLLSFFAASMVLVAPLPAGSPQRVAQANNHFTSPHTISATPVDGATRIAWTPGQDNQFFCVDTAFTEAELVSMSGSWHNWGCGTTATSLDLNALACDHVHFYRVWAAGTDTSGYTETGIFQSQPCSFRTPSQPVSTVLSGTSVRLSWNGSDANSYACIDLALVRSDLVSLSGSWFNLACGTQASVVDVSGLQCNTTYFWRVWVTNASLSYSPLASFHTAPC